MDLKLVLQIVGVALGLIYLYLEYKANIWLWVVGLIMPVVHGTLYLRSGLYADSAMQLYYILAGLYGLLRWHKDGVKKRGEKGNSASALTTSISQTPKHLWPRIVALYALIHLALYLLLSGLTDSTVPFWDSFTTALCIVAYWMLSRKYVEQWLVWLVVDVVTIGLYFYKDIPLTACLYVLYSALAIVGYRRWLRVMCTTQQ